MVLENVTMAYFSLGEAQSVTKPLVLFVVGIVAYAFFVFKFYRFLASRDIFDLNLQQYSGKGTGFFVKLLKLILYCIEYLLLFPLFSFFWFGIITALLAFLSKSNDISGILLIAMALVAAVRITAYFTEDLSKDLAKMLPFALLGVFLVDISYFSFQGSLEVLKQLPEMWKTIVYYLGFTILLEFVLRIGFSIISPFLSKEE
ncbi:MAG: hypothetical protein KJ601_07515 [Nanoarchaeota archaeon]|nr:hypothetical protein [Nanoarchaeota archaeon]